MEHREPPRMADAEGRPRDAVAEEGPPPRPRLARLVPRRRPVARRSPGSRRSPWAGRSRSRSCLRRACGPPSRSSRWLHGRQQYKVEFREIVLDPPAPAWYRWGSKGFLDRVRAAARSPRRMPALDLDLRKLVLTFQRYSWVKQVGGARLTHPNRLVVRLTYREPVARLRCRESGGGFRDIWDTRSTGTAWSCPGRTSTGMPRPPCGHLRSRLPPSSPGPAWSADSIPGTTGDRGPTRAWSPRRSSPAS